MLEREMEDLIAERPDQFFPRYGFKLTGRQQSFHGIGRFDLLFEDRHGMKILMELKAVPAKYEVIDQIAKYRDALVAQGQANFVMWVVAPNIPVGLRDFLSHLGIEFAEIHESEFRRVAALVGYSFANKFRYEEAEEVTIVSRGVGQSTDASQEKLKSGDRGIDRWGFGYSTQPSFLLKALEVGGKTKEEIRSDFIAHFYPGLGWAEAKSKSGFNVFFSDSKRPVGTYHASRALNIREDMHQRLTIDPVQAEKVQTAIARGILHQLRGIHFQRDKQQFDRIQESFGLPTEL